jgi:uncharacterized protein (DUF433 family)
MPDVLIENPILNSSFEEPTRLFKFTEDGITNAVVKKRRSSGYFVPIPQPKKKGKQLVFDSEPREPNGALALKSKRGDMTEIAPRIAVDENVRFGKPVIAGTRVPVDLVVGKLGGGLTIEQVMEEYGLAREDILAALSYAARAIGDELIRPVR